MRRCLVCLVLLCLWLVPAHAGPTGSAIRAVVNDQIITDYDVAARVKLALVSSGVPDTPQARQALTGQVLRGLIDETLQLQEAARLRITVTDADVAKGITLLEEQNRMPPGALKALLADKNVPMATLEQQLRANLAWAKLVQGRFGRRAAISDSEVAATQSRLAGSLGKPEYRVGEILVPITDSTPPASAEAAARRLFDQIRAGASFASLARQFSASPTAPVGGDMGWIMADDLDPPFNRLVTQMQPGQISAPLAAPDGYRLIVLVDRRLVGVRGTDNATVTLHQLVLPGPNITAELAKARQRGMQAGDAPDARLVAANERDLQVSDRAFALEKRIRSCADAERIAREEKLPLSGSLGTLPLKDLPATVQQKVLQTETGRAFATKVGESWAVMTVCAKSLPQARLPDAAAIREQLRLRKIERLAQQYLRDLRQGAYVDVRGT